MPAFHSMLRLRDTADIERELQTRQLHIGGMPSCAHDGTSRPVRQPLTIQYCRPSILIRGKGVWMRNGKFVPGEQADMRSATGSGSEVANPGGLAPPSD